MSFLHTPGQCEKKRKDLKVTLDQKADRSGIWWEKMENTFIKVCVLNALKCILWSLSGPNYWNAILHFQHVSASWHLPVGENKNDHKSTKYWLNESLREKNDCVHGNKYSKGSCKKRR